MARNQRRHKFTIGYGHTYSSSNSRADFSELKYKLNAASLKYKEVEFDSEQLTPAERKDIKNKIRKSNKEKTFKILLITVSILIVFIIIAIKLIETIF